MTRGLFYLQQLIVTRCASKYISVTNLTRKRLAESLIERNIKTSTDRTNLIKSYLFGQPNHNSRDFSFCNRTAKMEELPERKLHEGIEYLEAPVKSESDTKEYRVIKLRNGLTALLISDMHSKICASGDEDDKEKSYENIENYLDENIKEEDEDDDEDEEDDSNEDDEDDGDNEDDETGEEEEDSDAEGHTKANKRVKRDEKMAACALSIGVGNFSDPPEIPGMAHFVEHMVFMGSEKYPKENDFDAFITRRGGSDNASTDCEHTTFYFDIQERDFLPALMRFANFFVSPLMKKNAMTREREAVESEFQMALPHDQYRKEELFCTFALPNHPVNKFKWGNLVTLRDNVEDEKLYEELHKFRKRHYSAHRMKLAVQAKLSLDVLEKYVLLCFENIPNNELPSDDFSEFKGLKTFNTENFKRMYKIKPIKDICQVDLTWTMPSLHHLYKSKPHQYISWIIGHEGKGSLISYLREKMWCLNIFSGNGESGLEHSSMYALFSLSLILTDEGHKHLEEVLDAVFSFINLLKKEGPKKRIYDEIHQIEETNFRFVDEEQPVDYVEDLCDNMQYFPPRDYITGSELYFEYNPEAIQNCMDFLIPEEMNIIIFDKKFDDKEFNKLEPWFKTKYTDVEIPQEWIERWKTIEPLENFHLPLPNEYLVRDFSLMNLPADVPKYPVKIYNDDMSEIWYRPDPTFRLPECYMNFYFISPLTSMSSRNAALTDLYVTIVRQLLVEELYPATVADFTYDIATSEKGIIIKLNGYNEKISLLLMTIVRYLADYPNLIKQRLFEVMKKEQTKEYYNTFLKPDKVAKDARLAILMHGYWTCIDKYSAICDIDFDKFKSFVKSFTDYLFIQCLVQGNITQDAAISNVQQCIKILKCKPLLPDTMPQIKIAEIPVGIHYCKLKNFDKTDSNSIVTNYYQSGIGSITLSAIIDLLMMIMEEPLFNQLRTQEMLGYHVSCLFRDTFGIFGYSLTVNTQANKYTTEHVDERIEKFLKSFIKILEKITEADFYKIKYALMKVKQCADVHLKEEVSRNWQEITTKDYMFDRIEKEVLAIKEIKIDVLKKWIAKNTRNGNNFRKLSIHIVGSALQKTDDMKNNEQSNELEHIESNTVEDGEKIKYSFEYIIDDEQSRETQNNYINNMADYKKNLPTWPVTHTIL